MNLLTLACGIMMCILTIVMMASKIREGKALDAHGRPVDLGEDPLYFWLFTIFNFAFLISVSLTMIILAIFF